MSAADQLQQGLQTLGIALSAPAQSKLLAYASLLEKWNRTYRLTAVPNSELTVSHHLLDSLAVLPFVRGESLLDVGSGGGMPGIPLAIARPELRVVLLDSNSKKSAFLRQAAIELELANIAVHCGRVEAYRPADIFAVITARAFADLAELVRLSRHLLQAGGHWLAMKGVCPQAEIARLPADVALDALHRLEVPGVTGERHLVLLSKRAAGH
ncbi:MAG: 16S rRNA (guanine(527)-N(7))-methyltransferase RsmG [Candidatus Accumulibacter meliphilus]|jgi:16S rRNA (guanine527-N7)-methyltransferase|uniref:Ribosomal RNA small subunit methyltransferase G n=1 Tax=Candidatus Accumulibacter meliphilus TaxID=2211374 RepID=A0A369XP76_9PROT|nr:MAG: 16S rRNA (guanine(527)-N(7))-methyltransferase RsmG [Candidatus Accumulibacter meliphilus]